MKFWLNLCCQWKSWKSVNTVRADCWESTRQSAATGGKKDLKKHFRANKLCSTLQSYCRNICIRHRDPCSSLKPWVIYPLTSIERRGEKQRKIVSGALLTPIRVILLYGKYPQTSDATGAFYTASFISFMGSFPCIFACLWQNLESCHPPQQILKELPWLKHTNSNALLVSFQQPACWAPFTNIPTSQGSHCCFGCKEAFSLAVSFPKNILHAESCAHYPYSQPS